MRMKTVSKPVIGKILKPTEDYTRDAIHIPIMPIEAGEALGPGDLVFVAKGKAVSPPHPKDAVGIVDPFLTVMVKVGDRFYLWLKPQSTLRLWHEWTHYQIDGKA